MSDQTNTAVRPTVPTAQAVASPMPGFMGSGASPDYWCTLSPRSPREAETIFAMRQGPTLALSENINRPLAVVHILAHPIQVTSEQGELKDLVRFVFLTQDGMYYSCASEGVKSSLNLIFSLKGVPPYAEPLLLQAVNRKTRSGRTLMQLELVKVGAKK